MFFCIFLPGYCWYSREQAKKKKEGSYGQGTVQQIMQPVRVVQQPVAQPTQYQDQSGMRTDRFGNTIDRFGRTIVIAEPKVPRLPQNHRSLNQPTVF